jgi:hypothetical protein
MKPGIIILLLMLALPASLPAQNEITLDAGIFNGSVGYARHTSERVLLGVEIGFGFPQIDQTLEPPTDEETGTPQFEEYLHVGLFARWKVSRGFELDAGIRGSVTDLWPCGASDCWPALFAGGYVQPLIGWKRFKLGARLVAGISGDDRFAAPDQLEERTWVVSLSPFMARYTIPW